MTDLYMHKWKQFRKEEKRSIVPEDTSNKTLLKEAKSDKIKKGSEKRTIVLPIPKMSESWGQPDSADRKEIEAILARIAPRQAGFVNKIAKVNEFIEGCKGEEGMEVCKKYAVSTILSRLMALDILSAIVYDFNSSAGGFLFEAFMAAMLGKDAQQIIASQSRSEGEAGDIADILDDSGKPVSLKFFKEGGSKEIKGSVADLRNSINKYGMPIPYLVALKTPGATGDDVGNIDFYEFTIGATEGVPEGMGGDFNIDAKKDGGTYIKGTKFAIPVTVLTGKKVKQIDRIGTLKFGSPEDMKRIASGYINQLGQDVTNTYNYIDRLSKNVNSYLIRNSKKAGNEAVEDAKMLVKSAKKIAPED
jgi:hypothetical protein